MTEQNFQVVPIGIKYICDLCKEGEMEYTGNMLMTNPPQFTHKCNRCEVEKSFFKKYPTIEYKTL